MLRRDDQHVYFKNHVYIGEDSMFNAIAFEHTKMIAIFDRLQCTKLKIDTSDERWDDYVQEITALMDLKYQKEDPYPCDLKQYLGTYRWQNGTAADEWIIKYDDANQCLYTSLFWPYMPMRCAADNVFELISFPVELQFQRNKNCLQFCVHGNYDWEYNNQIFSRV